MRADKVAVITGGGSGLGAAMARSFAASGYAIAVLDIDLPSANATADEIRDSGGDALAMRVDVADVGSLAKAATAVEERFGACHVLCANVGVQQFGAIERLTGEDWAWVLSVNVVGTANTVTAFLPLLRAGDGDRHIGLTASSSVLAPGARLGAYLASKHAVVGLGEALRLELCEEGISVSLLFPAGMTTRHLESSIAARPSSFGPSLTADDDIEVMMGSRPLDRPMTVLDADQAARDVVADITAGERFIITHGDYREELIARSGQLLEAFDRRVTVDGSEV